jgi:hypothetical protein
MNKNTAVKDVLRLCGLRAAKAANSSRNAVLADDFIEEASTEVQQQGWPENTEDRVVLVRNDNDELTDTEVTVGLPADYVVLSVKPSGRDSSLLVMKRGNKLWWRDDSISTGTPWVSAFKDGLEITRILQLPFEELPEHLADYVAKTAARNAWGGEFVKQIDDRMRRQTITSTILTRYFEARSMARSFKHEKRRTNVLSTPEAARVRGRRRNMHLGLMEG